jgi:hypothetical protein
MTADYDRGRRELLGLSGVAAGALVLISLVAWLRGGLMVWTVAAGRPILVVAFALLALRGRRWARTLLVWWTGILAIVFGVSAIALAADKAAAAVMVLVLALGFGAIACRLYVSPHIRALWADRGATTSTASPAA